MQRLSLFFFFALCLCTSSAQSVFTEYRSYLYFDPQVSKQAGIRGVLITEHEVYLEKTKIKTAKPYSSARIFFDTAGVATHIIYLSNDRKHTPLDTVAIPEKFHAPYRTPVTQLVDGPNKTKIWHGNKMYGDDRMIKFDSLGNEIYNKNINHPVESVPNGSLSTNRFDSLNRLSESAYQSFTIEWNYSSNQWDTIIKTKCITVFHYENNKLTKSSSECYTKNKEKILRVTHYYYDKEGVLQKIEDDTSLTKDKPVKYLLLVSGIKRYPQH